MDNSKIMTYNLDLRAMLSGYSVPGPSLLFFVTIIDACMSGTFDLSPVTQFGPVVNYSIYKPADV